MMKRVLFIQNGEFEGPGLFATVLGEAGAAVEVVHAWRDEPVPDSPADWDGISIGGGSMSAYDTKGFPFLENEIALLRGARAAGKPVLGMCLGAQLMAAAFGGKVYPNTAKEIGFFDVRFSPAAQDDPLWRGHTATFRPVSWHGDAFSLPPGAVHLAESDLTPNQLFRLDDALYGLQFHLEIDRPLLAEMVGTDDGGGLPQYGIEPVQFLREAEIALPPVEKVARAIFSRWAGLA